MDSPDLRIIPYQPEYKDVVIKLWDECNLTKPWNNPERDIERMLNVYPELFLVGLINSTVVATVMGGYDGHRGWIYYLGILPEYRRRGYATKMMDAITAKLRDIGCPKINIQVRSENAEVIGFYNNIGYITEDRISMGKRLVTDGQ